MRMLRVFKVLSFQFAQMFLSCTMFQPTTKARNYRIYNVCALNGKGINKINSEKQISSQNYLYLKLSKGCKSLMRGVVPEA
jgi:hypothetical protein